MAKAQPCSLQVRSGEIVGWQGWSAPAFRAGAADLRRAKATGGMIEVDGEPVVIHSRARPLRTASVFSPRTARSRGYSGAGGAGEHHHGDVGARRHLRLAEPQKAQSISDDAIALFQYPRAAFSGARRRSFRRQPAKLLISRWVAIGPRILILTNHARRGRRGKKRDLPHHEPDGAQRGGDPDDLQRAAGSSRNERPVYVMREGSIAGELHGRDISQENIMTLATGVNDTHIIRRCNHDNPTHPQQVAKSASAKKC